MSKKGNKDPLEPIASAITALVVLTGIAGVVGLGVLVLNLPNTSAFGIGGDTVCATDPNTSTSVEYPRGLPGVSTNAEGVRLCAENPSTYQQVLAALVQLPALLAFVVALVLVRRFLRRAQAHGVYSATVPRAVRDVGGFIVVASLLVTLCQSFANASLIDTMTDSGPGFYYSTQWNPPLMPVLTGLGVLTFARIMRIGAEMRADLDGTI